MAVAKFITIPSFKLMRWKLIEAEIEEESGLFRDFLFGIVPINRLGNLFAETCRSQSSSFAPNYFDLKNKWFEIEAEEVKKAESKNLPSEIERCIQNKSHANEVGDILAFNPFSEADELLPCPHCRAEDNVRWKKNQIALYGELPKPAMSHGDALNAIGSKSMSREPREVYLDPVEAQRLVEEYNALVARIVDIKESQTLLIIFDEGVNRFRHPNRTNLLYTEKDVKSKIESYNEIIAKREGVA